MACYVEGTLVARQLEKLATQYRESPNMKAYIAVFLRELEAVQKALCDSFDFDLDRLGVLLDFPRCWCNIKRRVWFGLERPAELFFGFTYEDGETVTVPESCIGGLGESRWLLPEDDIDCLLAAQKRCCTVGDPTVDGFCDAEFFCKDYPQHVDHCFTDDAEYANLLKAKLVSDNANGSISDILNVAQILYGVETTINYDNHGVVWLSLNRAMTDNEILLIDFYKNLIPVPISVNIFIVDGLSGKQFGFTKEQLCAVSTVDGFCDGILMRRY